MGSRPRPSLWLLAFIAVILALALLGRRYLWPAHSASGRAAIEGYQTAANAPPEIVDEGTAAAQRDAGGVWALQHHPNSAAGCPASPAAFHDGCAAVVSP